MGANDVQVGGAHYYLEKLIQEELGDE